MREFSETAEEVARELGSVDKAVSHEYIIEHTSVEDTFELEDVLLELMDAGLITTPPDFSFRLARNSAADEFRE